MQEHGEGKEGRAISSVSYILHVPKDRLEQTAFEALGSSISKLGHLVIVSAYLQTHPLKGSGHSLPWV